MAIFGGCFRRVLGLAVLVVVLIGAWLYRAPLLALFHDERATAVAAGSQPSAEQADAAEDKLQDLASGKAQRAALSGPEVQSLLRYRYARLLPVFVDSPRVEIADGRIRLLARVPVDKLPRTDELGEAAAFLPDTAELSVTGQVLPLDSVRVALAVVEVTAAHIPLPKGLVPGALERLGRRDEPGLPRDAIALPLPPGASAAYLRGDSLIFLSRDSRD